MCLVVDSSRSLETSGGGIQQQFNSKGKLVFINLLLDIVTWVLCVDVIDIPNPSSYISISSASN